MTSLRQFIDSGNHIIIHAFLIIRELQLPDDICSFICGKAFNITMHDINTHKCYKFITNKLITNNIARVKINNQSRTTYAVRKYFNNTTPCTHNYIINSAFTQHNDLYKLCRDIAHSNSINVTSGTNYGCLFEILNDFITENPLQIRAILSNFKITVYDLLSGFHSSDGYTHDIIYKLIIADCKQELLTCGLTKQFIFYAYLRRQSPLDRLTTRCLLNYPLFVQYFDLLMACPLPLTTTIPAMLAAVEFD